MSYMKQLWIEREQARAEAYLALELDLEEGEWPSLKRPKLTEKMLDEAFKAPSLKKLEKYFQTIKEEAQKRIVDKGSPDIIFGSSPPSPKEYLQTIGEEQKRRAAADKPKVDKVDVDTSLRKQRDAQLRRIFT